MADTDLTVRRYRPTDGPSVRTLHERVMRAAGAFVGGVAEPDLDDVTAAYLDAGGEFLLGERDGTVVAMCGYRPAEGYLAELISDTDDATAEVKRMRVAPEYRRHRYAQRLCDELEHRARPSGFDTSVLDT
jgi:ribosomal protein S18 acetylase RimI-like enzyme